MNQNEGKMDLTNPVLEGEAERLPVHKKRGWAKWVVAGICLCVILGFVAVYKICLAPKSREIRLPKRSTATVTLGYDEDVVDSVITHVTEMHRTEEELFNQWNMYAFRGVITDLTNITIDFDGDKVVRCIATIQVDRVYRGDLETGKPIEMLLPYGWIVREDVQDPNGTTWVKVGTEGIFMPRIYDSNELPWEKNGKTFFAQDLVPCSLESYTRYVFINTGTGVRFDRRAYKSASKILTFEEIEAYVIKMLQQ